MPGGDRTGPRGLGPRTGRALGYCSGYDTPGYEHPGFGRGFDRGWGRGFGRGYWGRRRGYWWRSPQDPVYLQPFDIERPFYYSKEEEKTYLEHMIKSLEDELKLIQTRLQELSKDKKDASD